MLFVYLRFLNTKAAMTTTTTIMVVAAAMSRVSVEMPSVGGATEGERVGVEVADAVVVGAGLRVDVGVGGVVGCADAAPTVM